MRALVPLVLLLAPAALAGAPVVEERLYVAEHAIGASTGVFDCDGRAVGVGGVCFYVPAGATSISLEVIDVTGAPVGANAAISGPCAPANLPREAYCIFPFGQLIERIDPFCQRTSAPLPAGANIVIVWIREDWVFNIRQPDTCGSWPEPETAGVVRATFA